ncbi:MAG: saccharopine dehydrogenase NADP-binding domain-containing protein [Anaerolineales bacterium]|nr:saccharopine dehydrogenase NADP-binding domain-containing protein [Anaerolineales bacterium]
MKEFLLYGANGYTGSLIAHAAVDQGLHPILAGRNPAQIETLAQQLKLESRIAALDDPNALDQLLKDVPVVLHAAGPYAYTAKPMVDACLRNRVHYLDITGEISVFEALAQRNEEARRAGVMLLPGAGFDVVPSDNLAAHLKRRLPSATRLSLAIRSLSRISRGTAITMLETIGRGEGGLVRKQGKLTPVPMAWKTRDVDFGRGVRPTVTIPWGDVSTAYYSTGIPDIEVYMAFSPVMIQGMRAGRYVGWMLQAPGVKTGLKAWVRSGQPGPTPEERAAGKSYLWGQVEDDEGNAAESRLITQEGYTLTMLTALRITRNVLAGQVKIGFQTPSTAYGPDLIMEIPGVVRTDL